MFQIVSNIFNRSIITEVSLDEYINMMKNPDILRKSQVDLARKTYKESSNKKDDPLYKSIKNSLPCITFLNTFKEYANNENIIGSTGFMYLDIDNVSDINISQFSFVVAYWKSLSNNGYGILIKCDNTSDLQENIKEISNILGIKLDKNAVSKDRLNVIGYDTNIYYNPDYTSYVFKDCKIGITNLHNTVEYRYVNKDTENIGEIRFSNIDELLSNYDFNGEPFIDLGDDKLEYAEVFVPKNIFEGNRNKSMFVLCSQIRGLNTWISKNLLFKVCNTINIDKFRPALDEEELMKIVENVINKQNPVVVLNKTKRILFNPDYKFSGTERKSMSIKQIRSVEGDKNTKKIIDCVVNWDYTKNGKLSQSKIAKELGFGIATVKRRSEKIKEILQEINLDS